MKRILLFVSLTMVLGLFGCVHTIDRVEQRWGPPAGSEQQGDYTLYYYSFNKVGRRGPGVLNVTLTCDNAGNILSKSQTWEPSESVAPLPSPYMKKRVRTVQPLHEEAEASADASDVKKEEETVQPLHEEVEASADPPDMKKKVAMVQSLHAEVQISADPPETDPDVALGVGVEGPPEGNGVYYDGPFDIDGISLYYFGGGFYYAAPGDPHRLLFHHRCPPSQLGFYRDHWRNGWRGFHDRWVESHKQPLRNDPKREIHRDVPVNKASKPPSRTYTSSKASTPPPKTYTSSKTSTPPIKTHTSSKASTPPINTYTPPPKTYTPPPKVNTPPPAYTPPPRTYTPPPVYTPPPRTYTPPPKHYNPMTKRWE
jgi:hypothetical protein